jgi:PAS domain S-box-containing protein
MIGPTKRKDRRNGEPRAAPLPLELLGLRTSTDLLRGSSADVQGHEFCFSELRMGKRASSKNGTAILVAVPSSAADETRTNEEISAHLAGETGRDYVLYTLDRSGRIVTWNSGAELMTGYGALEVIGKHFSIFYTPEDEAAAEPTSHLLAAVDGRTEHETWRLRKNKTRFRANVVLTPLRDRWGDLTGFVELVRDLTGREQTKEEDARLLSVEEVLRLRQELFTQAHRTLDTTLVGMRVHLEALRGTVTTLTGERVVAKLDMLEWGLDRLAKSVNHVLTLAQDISAKLAEELKRR